MPNQRKRLGTALEHEVVDRARARGLKARRQPMSGQLKEFPADAEVESLLVECKVRAAHISARGAKTLTLDLDWLKGVQRLAAGADYEAGIVIIRPKGSSELMALVPCEWLFANLKRLYYK